MTRLMFEILKDPDAVFELDADLPTGNRMMGTVGPLIGDRLVSSITFVKSPASEEDITIARRVLDTALGQPSVFALVSNSEAERSANLAELRKFMETGCANAIEDPKEGKPKK